jgi:outer membrane protein
MTRKGTLIKAVIVLGLALSSGLPAQEKMNLQKFIDEAVRNSAAVQIAGESVSGAEYKIQEARSQYLPQVNAGSSYTRLSLLSEFDIPGMGHFKFGTPNSLSLRLGASEQVFTWGRVGKAVAMSRIGKDLAEGNLALTSQILAYQVVPIFYGVLFAGEAVKVIDASLASLNGKLAILEERFLAGLVSDLDISLLKVQTSGLKSQRLDFLNGLNDMMMVYNRIAGRPLESTFVPDASLGYEPFRAEAAALLAEAVANRPEANLVRGQRELVQTQIALARTANKPNLIASFNYEFRNGFLPSVDRIKGNWNAVLAISYPVFDGHRTSAQVAQTQVDLRMVEKQAADLERGFDLEIHQTLADLKTLEQKIEIEKTKTSHAERAVKIADERYQNGLISITDLVEAQDSLDSARLNYLQLVYNHTLSKFALYRSCGRII